MRPFNVEDTQKKVHGLYLHDGVVEKGALHVGDQVALEVDHGRRAATRAHHSATHLLHEALRQVLGGHVAQKGSLVEPGRLRFDFSHQKPMTHEEIRAVEDLANAMILQNEAVETHLMTPDQAIAQGALALFGEKYGDEVRVVCMGSSDKSTKSGHAYSIELCGGTHVRRTGDIGLLKIVSESAVASGVRRIEALTGEAARFYLAAQDERVREAAELLKVTPDEMINRLAAIIDERRKLERQLADAKRELALGGGAGSGGDGAGAAMVRDLGKVKLLARTVHGVAPKDLRGLVDDAKKQLGSGVVAVIGVSDEGKAGLVVGVTADLTGTYDAVELARIGAEALGGKGGGGRPDLAQAGGPDGEHADKALEAIAAKIAGGEGASPSASEAKRPAPKRMAATSVWRGWRREVHDILEVGGDAHPAGRFVNVFIVVLIFLNAIAFAAETVEALSQPLRLEFETFNVFSVIVFTIEYVLRLWSSVEIPMLSRLPRWRPGSDSRRVPS